MLPRARGALRPSQFWRLGVSISPWSSINHSHTLYSSSRRSCVLMKPSLVIGRINTTRTFSSYANETKLRNQSLTLYLMSIVVSFVGLSYAAVPLYKVFCQVTGYGGTTRQITMQQAKDMVPVADARPIKISFDATTPVEGLEFKPSQKQILLVPGEVSLAFYTVRNTTNKPLTLVATYNVSPPRAGLYFSKVQCFCFDGHTVSPAKNTGGGDNEEIVDLEKGTIDLPVLFYIDPTFLDDPQMEGIDDIILSYTFFRAK